jgi:hypothetical protein
MAIFIIGVISAVVVAATYLILAARDFQRVRAEVNRSPDIGRAAGAGLGSSAAEDEAGVDPARETVGFAWRALGGVLASVTLLYAISHVWWAWYLFPVLALGTGVAVSVAFVVDPTRSS